MQAQCAPVALQWRGHHSLTEQLAGLEAVIAAPREETLQQIYDRLHREILGTRSRRTLSNRNQDAFARVATLLIARAYDPPTFVAGNMWAMKPWVEKHPEIGFQPTHLQGEKAERRYFAYRGRQARRFRQQRHTGETSGTLLADLRQQLYLGEFDVGLAYVRAYVADGSADWQEAIVEAKPGLDWIAVESQGQGRQARRFAELGTSFGELRLRTEKQIAEFKAACAVAESYEHDLAHRVGAGPRLSWPSFAELIARLYPLPALDTVSSGLKGLEGVLWHGFR